MLILCDANLPKESDGRRENFPFRHKFFSSVTCSVTPSIRSIISGIFLFNQILHQILTSQFIIWYKGNNEGVYSVVQKNSSMFELPACLLPTNQGQPMHSPSAMTEHVSLNLAWFFFALCCTFMNQYSFNMMENQIRYRCALLQWPLL